MHRQTELTVKEKIYYHWSKPVKSDPADLDEVRIMTAVNKIEEMVDLYAGTYSPQRPPDFEPAFYYKTIQ